MILVGTLVVRVVSDRYSRDIKMILIMKYNNNAKYNTSQCPGQYAIYLSDNMFTRCWMQQSQVKSKRNSMEWNMMRQVVYWSLPQ